MMTQESQMYASGIRTAIEFLDPYVQGKKK